MSRGFWKKFLIDAGIPVKAADSYTSSFVDNRISETMVPDLSKSVLIDLGITIIGDVIAILKHAIHVTEEASAERKERKKQRPDKRRPSSERKSKKVEPEKKTETTPAPEKKTEEKQAAKTKEEKTILKVGHATERKPTQPPTKTDKPPRKVRITDQIVAKERTPDKPAPQQEVKRSKVKKEVQSTRTVSVPTKPEHKTRRTVSSTPPKVDKTQLRKASTHVKQRVTPIVKHVHVAQTVKHVTASVKHHVTPATVKHVTIMEDREQRVRPAVQKAHLVKRHHEELESEDSDSSSGQHSPVSRRVFGGAARNTDVVSRDVVSRGTARNTDVVSRDVALPSRGEIPRDSSESEGDRSPVFVRRPPADSYSSIQSANEPVITRRLPEEPCTITRLLPEEPRAISRNVSGITRNVSGNVTRTVQTVRCVSPDSTTDTPPPKPKQTTTIILNTKGKCSVRPVSPPLDMKVDRKRKVLPRNDGKTTLTRVVQRHLDASSPRHSPKRNKNSSPKMADNKDSSGLKSEKYNSFRSDAEISELLSNNKFRSEDDSFDIIPEKKQAQIRRKVRSRSFSDGRTKTSLSSRLGSARDSDLRKSLPSKFGGVAARVFSENRLSSARGNRASLRKTSGRISERISSGRTSGSLRSQDKERSVFNRLGD